MSEINEELSSADAAAVTKVMLSMHASYGEINAVRDKMNKGDVTAGLLLDIITKIARSTSLFNAFVAEYKKNESVEESVEELDEAFLDDLIKGLNSKQLSDLLNYLAALPSFRSMRASIKKWKEDNGLLKIPATRYAVEGLTEAAKMTNGVKWKLAPEKDRLRGEYYVTYDVNTKKMVAFGLTREGAKAIADTDPENLKSASADFFADRIMKKGVTEEIALDEAIPADQTTYFNLARSIKKTGVSNSGNTKFVSGSYVYTLEKKDGIFGSIRKIDDARKVLWTVSLTPVKELNDAPKLVFSGITRDEFIKLKNTSLNEGVLTEEDATKLVNDITSLKRIGWNLDRITKHLITSKEYGIQMTSDMIKNIFSPPKMGAPTKGTKPAKGDQAPSGWGMRKNVKWPKDPPASRLNDPTHAEGWLAQAVDSGESPDIEGGEAAELLRQAGYTHAVIARVMKNMGWEHAIPALPGAPRPIAKKTPKMRFESISNFRGSVIEESAVKSLLGKSHEQLLKLHYSKFPGENDPDLRTLSYTERSGIMKAKDAVFAASKDVIKKDKMKVGKGAFKISGAKVNDYTSLGQVTKISDSGVTFNGGKEVSFDSMLVGNESVFAKIAKMTKAEFDSQTKSKKDAHAALMAAHTKATPNKID